MPELPYINLGCGSKFDKGWTNIDFISNSEFVIAHNLLQGIPFPDNSFEFVYHSHVLEHMPKNYASVFINECYRILKPGGIIRVVIPDLEQIALNYIKYLNEALQNVPGADKKYEWTMIEMYDQVVRSKTGGEMLEYIQDVSKENDAFLLERNGMEAESLMKMVRNKGDVKKSGGLRKILSGIYHFGLKKRLIKGLTGKDYSAFESGVFRSHGEIHQWMYDRYSIKKILEENKFRNVDKKTAFTSYLKNWSDFNMDGENGKVRKPDSLFIEALK